MAFLVGVILGSFSTVVGVRLPRRDNWWSGRSRCPHCGVTLRATELVPLVSYVLQLGRCRHCRVRIPFVYMFVELLGGVYSALTFMQHGLSLAWGLSVLTLLFCVVLIVSDSVYMVVPNRVLLFLGVPLVLLYSVQQEIYSMITGAVVAFTLLYTIHILTGGIGAGDVKLVAVLGALVQIEQLFFMLSVACIIGFCMFVVRRERIIPFAPALCVATLVTLYVDDLHVLTFY